MKLILVDCGYLLFYRYHATKIWYRKAHDYHDDLQMALDPLFQKMYQKKIIDCLDKYIKLFQTCWDYVIFCRDTKRSHLWRNNILPEYKQQRDHTKLTGLKTCANLLKLVIMQLIREKNAKSIGVYGVEADDIVYQAIQYFNHTNNQFMIIASDHDYYQVCYQNVILQRLDNKPSLNKSVRHRQPHLTNYPKIDLLIKILMGDKSDNIPSVFPKCGMKTAEKLALDKNLLQTRFIKYPDSITLFNRNKMIICLNQLPINLKSNITNRLKTLKLV